MVDRVHDLALRVVQDGVPHAYLPLHTIDLAIDEAGAGGSFTMLKGIAIPVPDPASSTGTSMVAIIDALPARSVISISKRGHQIRHGWVELLDFKEEIITDGSNTVEEITWSFRSLVGRLDEVLAAYPVGDAALDDPVSGLTPGEHIRRHWAAAASRGLLDDLTRDWDGTTDSYGVAWQSLVTRTVPAAGRLGAEVSWLRQFGAARCWSEGSTIRLADAVAGSGTVDWTDPGDTGNTLGRAVHWSAGRDLVNAPREGTSGELATRVLVLGDEQRWALAVDEAAEAAGQLPRELPVNASGLSDLDALQRVADLKLQLVATPRVVTGFELHLGHGHDPLDVVNIGDRVGIHTTGLPWTATLTRVDLSLDPNGQVTCRVAVDDWIASHEEYVLGLIDSILNGTGEGIRPSRNTLRPAAPAPTAPTLEVIPPVDGGIEQIRITIPALWSGLDEDGAPCTDFATFIAQVGFGDAGWEHEATSDELPIVVDIPAAHAERVARIRVGARDNAGNTGWAEVDD